MKPGLDAEALLGNLDARLFHDSGNPVCLCDTDFCLIAWNHAWEAFALANGGEAVLNRWGVGSCMLDAVPDALREHYRTQWSRVLETGESFREEYDCSSPERRRRFLATVYPVGGGRGLLMAHSLLRDELVGDDPEALVAEYRNRAGVVVQCSHCRRVKRQSGRDTWDWVPALEQPVVRVTVSHGFCPLCLEHYHPA